jgi:hypothetical protein
VAVNALGSIAKFIIVALLSSLFVYRSKLAVINAFHHTAISPPHRILDNGDHTRLLHSPSRFRETYHSACEEVQNQRCILTRTLDILADIPDKSARQHGLEKR